MIFSFLVSSFLMTLSYRLKSSVHVSVCTEHGPSLSELKDVAPYMPWKMDPGNVSRKTDSSEVRVKNKGMCNEMAHTGSNFWAHKKDWGWNWKYYWHRGALHVIIPQFHLISSVMLAFSRSRAIVQDFVHSQWNSDQNICIWRGPTRIFGFKRCAKLFKELRAVAS